MGPLFIISLLDCLADLRLKFAVIYFKQESKNSNWDDPAMNV